MRDKKVIILDNYLSELFIVFNQRLHNEKDSKYLEPLFYKLMCESYFLSRNIKFAAIYKTLTKNRFCEVGKMHIRQVTRDSKPQYLFPQQTFLVTHEAIHNFFKDFPDEYEAQKEAFALTLDRIFYHKKIGHIKMFSDEYLEELCCDHLAAISAITISTEHGHCTEMDAACAIIMALHYQFLLLCIDRIVDDNYLSDKVGEFAVRVTVIRLFVSNYFKVTKPELVDNINNNISDKINAWEKRYLELFTAFFRIQRINRLKYKDVEISGEVMQKLRRGMIKAFSKSD